jgi:hypothetical protein
MNQKYIPQALMDLNSKETQIMPLIDFSAIDALVLDLLEQKPLKIKHFIVPDWPCAEWYEPLHSRIVAEAVELPDEEDLFVMPGDNSYFSLGKFSWKHWLFELRDP